MRLHFTFAFGCHRCTRLGYATFRLYTLVGSPHWLRGLRLRTRSCYARYCAFTARYRLPLRLHITARARTTLYTVCVLRCVACHLRFGYYARLCPVTATVGYGSAGSPVAVAVTLRFGSALVCAVAGWFVLLRLLVIRPGCHHIQFCLRFTRCGCLRSWLRITPLVAVGYRYPHYTVGSRSPAYTRVLATLRVYGSWFTFGYVHTCGSHCLRTFPAFTPRYTRSAGLLVAVTGLPVVYLPVYYTTVTVRLRGCLRLRSVTTVVALYYLLPRFTRSWFHAARYPLLRTWLRCAARLPVAAAVRFYAACGSATPHARLQFCRSLQFTRFHLRLPLDRTVAHAHLRFTDCGCYVYIVVTFAFGSPTHLVRRTGCTAFTAFTRFWLPLHVYTFGYTAHRGWLCAFTVCYLPLHTLPAFYWFAIHRLLICLRGYCRFGSYLPVGLPAGCTVYRHCRTTVSFYLPAFCRCYWFGSRGLRSGRTRFAPPLYTHAALQVQDAVLVPAVLPRMRFYPLPPYRTVTTATCPVLFKFGFYLAVTCGYPVMRLPCPACRYCTGFLHCLVVATFTLRLPFTHAHTLRFARSPGYTLFYSFAYRTFCPHGCCGCSPHTLPHCGLRFAVGWLVLLRLVRLPFTPRTFYTRSPLQLPYIPYGWLRYTTVLVLRLPTPAFYRFTVVAYHCRFTLRLLPDCGCLHAVAHARLLPLFGLRTVTRCTFAVVCVYTFWFVGLPVCWIVVATALQFRSFWFPYGSGWITVAVPPLVVRVAGLFWFARLRTLCRFCCLVAVLPLPFTRLVVTHVPRFCLRFTVLTLRLPHIPLPAHDSAYLVAHLPFLPCLPWFCTRSGFCYAFYALVTLPGYRICVRTRTLHSYGLLLPLRSAFLPVLPLPHGSIYTTGSRLHLDYRGCGYCLPLRGYHSPRWLGSATRWLPAVTVTPFVRCRAHHGYHHAVTTQVLTTPHTTRIRLPFCSGCCRARVACVTFGCYRLPVRLPVHLRSSATVVTCCPFTTALYRSARSTAYRFTYTPFTLYRLVGSYRIPHVGSFFAAFVCGLHTALPFTHRLHVTPHAGYCWLPVYMPLPFTGSYGCTVYTPHTWFAYRSTVATHTHGAVVACRCQFTAVTVTRTRLVALHIYVRYAHTPHTFTTTARLVLVALRCPVVHLFYHVLPVTFTHCLRLRYGYRYGSVTRSFSCHYTFHGSGYIWLHIYHVGWFRAVYRCRSRYVPVTLPVCAVTRFARLPRLLLRLRLGYTLRCHRRCWLHTLPLGYRLRLRLLGCVTRVYRLRFGLHCGWLDCCRYAGYPFTVYVTVTTRLHVTFTTRSRFAVATVYVVALPGCGYCARLPLPFTHGYAHAPRTHLCIAFIHFTHVTPRFTGSTVAHYGYTDYGSVACGYVTHCRYGYHRYVHVTAVTAVAVLRYRFVGYLLCGLPAYTTRLFTTVAYTVTVTHRLVTHVYVVTRFTRSTCRLLHYTPHFTFRLVAVGLLHLVTVYLHGYGWLVYILVTHTVGCGLHTYTHARWFTYTPTFTTHHTHTVTCYHYRLRYTVWLFTLDYGSRLHVWLRLVTLPHVGTVLPRTVYRGWVTRFGWLVLVHVHYTAVQFTTLPGFGYLRLGYVTVTVLVTQLRLPRLRLQVYAVTRTVYARAHAFCSLRRCGCTHTTTACVTTCLVHVYRLPHARFATRLRVPAVSSACRLHVHLPRLPVTARLRLRGCLPFTARWFCGYRTRFGLHAVTVTLQVRLLRFALPHRTPHGSVRYVRSGYRCTRFSLHTTHLLGSVYTRFRSLRSYGWITLPQFYYRFYHTLPHTHTHGSAYAHTHTTVRGWLPPRLPPGYTVPRGSAAFALRFLHSCVWLHVLVTLPHTRGCTFAFAFGSAVGSGSRFAVTLYTRVCLRAPLPDFTVGYCYRLVLPFTFRIYGFYGSRTPVATVRTLPFTVRLPTFPLRLCRLQFAVTRLLPAHVCRTRYYVCGLHTRLPHGCRYRGLVAHTRLPVTWF